MSKALSIGELADLLASTWTVEAEAAFQPLDAVPLAWMHEGTGFVETAVAAQGGGAPVPRHFAPDPDVARSLNAIPQTADEDPIRAAWKAGFDNGVATEKRLAAELQGEERQAIDLLRDQISQIGTDSLQELESRIREAVMALCRQVIDDCPIPAERLVTRIGIAVRMLARPHNEKTIELNPLDLDMLGSLLPAEWKLAANARLMRGTIRVVTAEGGIEDGPEQWKLALEEAIRTC